MWARARAPAFVSACGPPDFLRQGMPSQLAENPGRCGIHPSHCCGVHLAFALQFTRLNQNYLSPACYCDFPIEGRPRIDLCLDGDPVRYGSRSLEPTSRPSMRVPKIDGDEHQVQHDSQTPHDGEKPASRLAPCHPKLLTKSRLSPEGESTQGTLRSADHKPPKARRCGGENEHQSVRSDGLHRDDPG